jgi:hypothetical protein
MKKISTLLTLLIVLTFSGTSVATSGVYKCKISYTQQKPAKVAYKDTITSEICGRNYCENGEILLTLMIMQWLSEDTTNIVTGLGDKLKCKMKGNWSWGMYHTCKPHFRNHLLENLKEKYPNQVEVPDPE